MNADSAVEWLSKKKFNFWRLETSTGTKVDDYDPEEGDADAAISELGDLLQMASPGKYILKGWNGKHKQAAQSNFAFEIPRQRAETSSRANSSTSMEELFLKAKSEAYKEYQLQQTLKEMREDIDFLKKEFIEVKKMLNDEDPENDEDAVSKLNSLTEKIPGLAAGFDSLKEMLSSK